VYIPPAFRETDRDAVHACMREARLATLVTATAEGLVATPLPLLLAADEGEMGTLYGHIARANPHARLAAIGDALAIFAGPDAYVRPSWYADKPDGKVVPTWNYVAVHAYGPLELFEDAGWLAALVAAQTDRQESGRPAPWSLDDAPADFVAARLKGIVGVRLPIRRLDAKTKMSQNRDAGDRATIAANLKASADPRDRDAGARVPVDPA
jgi:transcriptional regulator